MSKPSRPGTVAQCSKCGLKHQRPVGVRCRRNLNLSAPVITDSHHEQPEQHSPRVAHQSGELATEFTAPDASVEGNTSKVSQVESKLEILLQKVQDPYSLNLLIPRNP